MRIRSDLKFGTITDNPLAIGAVTVNSAQFSTLPTVAGTDELYLTLDPEGSNREIVRVTAHAAAATSVTVQRGQLGTAAAQHALSTRWAHGAVTTDLIVPCTSSTRPSVGLWAGMTIYETDTGKELTYDGGAWVEMGRTGAWTAFTPTWTSTGVAPTIGNGTISGRYRRAGRAVTFAAEIVIGSTTAGGSGTYGLGLPVATAAGLGFSLPVLIQAAAIHPAIGYAGASTSSLFPIGYGNSVTFAAAAPALAAGNKITWGGTYEAAS